MELTMRLLDAGKVTTIYKKYMISDFPRSERKPLASIQKKIRQNLYLPYGIFEGSSLIAYAFFCKGKHSHYILLDYLAVCPKYRSSGYGTKILPVLAQFVQNSGYYGIVGEVENPKYYHSEEDRLTKEKRLRFYLRDRFQTTPIVCHMFGTKMIVLKLDFHNADTDTIYNSMQDIYRVNFTWWQRMHVRLYKISRRK